MERRARGFSPDRLPLPPSSGDNGRSAPTRMHEPATSPSTSPMAEKAARPVLWMLGGALAFSAIVWRRLPTAGEALGVVTALVGMVLIQQPHLGGDRFAALVALLSSFATAIAMIGLHRLRGIDARAIVAHFAGVASLFAGAW